MSQTRDLEASLAPRGGKVGIAHLSGWVVRVDVPMLELFFNPVGFQVGRRFFRFWGFIVFLPTGPQTRDLEASLAPRGGKVGIAHLSG